MVVQAVGRIDQVRLDAVHKVSQDVVDPLACTIDQRAERFTEGCSVIARRCAHML